MADDSALRNAAFREVQRLKANGRIARALSTLMALQAGLPPLDFGSITGKATKGYFAAIQRGMDRDYQPMERLFAVIIERSLAGT
jgi:cell filamentation protein